MPLHQARVTAETAFNVGTPAAEAIQRFVDGMEAAGRQVECLQRPNGNGGARAWEYEFPTIVGAAGKPWHSALYVSATELGPDARSGDEVTRVDMAFTIQTHRTPDEPNLDHGVAANLARRAVVEQYPKFVAEAAAVHEAGGPHSGVS